MKGAQGSGLRAQGKCSSPEPRTPNPQLVRLRGSGGFTFVELLIVGLIVVLVVNGMAWALASTGQNIWRRTDSEMTLLVAVQRALDRVSEDLRRATQGYGVAADQPSCAGEQITFKRDTNWDGKIDGLDDTVIYRRDAATNTLVRTVNNGAPQIMAGQIIAFTPSCQANGLVRLQLTAQVAMTSTANVTQVLNSQVRVQNP